MTKVAILPVPAGKGKLSYCAIAGDKHSRGDTAGEALDALTAQFTGEQTGTIVIVQNLRPDGFFDEVNQKRLTELMALWHAAGESGQALPLDQQAELEELVKLELRASEARTAALANESGR